MSQEQPTNCLHRIEVAPGECFIIVSPKGTARFLTLVVLCLTLVSVAGQYSAYYLGHPSLFGLVRLFNVSKEGNVPTWFSSSMLLLCSTILVVIATMKKKTADRYLFHWKALAIIFLYLSIDEMVEIHEMTIHPLRSTLHLSGLFYYSWVILGIIFVTAFAIIYWRFLYELPVKTRYLFLLAGLTYVGSALGLEMISGYHASHYGVDNMMQKMISTIEELGEMLGVVIFIYALLSYANSYLAREIRIRLSDNKSSAPFR